MSIKDMFQGCELFFDMYDEEIEGLVKSQLVHHAEPSDYLVKEGDTGDQIFIVLDGIIELTRTTDKGEFVIEKLKHGDVFGVLMLIDSYPYAINIRAKTKASILEIKHQHIMDLFKKNPKVFSVISLNISRLLAKRVRNAYAAINKAVSSSSQAA